MYIMSSPWSSLRYSPFAHLTLAGSPCPATTEFLIFLLGLTGSIFPFLVSALSSNVVGLFTVPGGRRSAQHAGRPRKVPVRGSHSTWRVRKTVDGPVISIDLGFWGWGGDIEAESKADCAASWGSESLRADTLRVGVETMFSSKGGVGLGFVERLPKRRVFQRDIMGLF